MTSSVSAQLLPSFPKYPPMLLHPLRAMHMVYDKSLLAVGQKRPNWIILSDDFFKKCYLTGASPANFRDSNRQGEIFSCKHLMIPWYTLLLTHPRTRRQGRWFELRFSCTTMVYIESSLCLGTLDFAPDYRMSIMAWLPGQLRRKRHY